MDSFQWFKDLVDDTTLAAIWLAVWMSFTTIYVAYAGASLLLTRRILPRAGIGTLIVRRPLAPGQVQFEVVNSLCSIAVFAVYGVVTIYLNRIGFIRIDWNPSILTVIINLVLLTFWNEVHFYLCHRLLHIRWLYRKVHSVHHRSIVPTPFTTFSFHWFEAVLLSSVMLWLLLVWPLDIFTIMAFPLLSLVANSIGHMNYAVFPHKTTSELFAACQRHTAHHTKWAGNYGFYLPWLDRWLGTRLQLPNEGRVYPVSDVESDS